MISTHLNAEGNPTMVDISHKKLTVRTAMASSSVEVGADLVKRLQLDPQTIKGNLFSVCTLAGIMAAKKTSDLIPLCHPLPLSKVEVTYTFDHNHIVFHSEVKTEWSTGVEMEAMMAANIAAMTCYDMLKSENKGIVLSQTKLITKTGGKSGDYQRC